MCLKTDFIAALWSFFSFAGKKDSDRFLVYIFSIEASQAFTRFYSKKLPNKQWGLTLFA